MNNNYHNDRRERSSRNASRRNQANHHNSDPQVADYADEASYRENNRRFYQDDHEHDDNRITLRHPRNNSQQHQQQNYQQRRNSQRYVADYDDYPQPASPTRKILLISLGVLGAAAIAAGIYTLMRSSNDAQIVAVTPNIVTTQEAYQDCRKVGTTTYVRNQKNGTNGALIGGATGAIAGGVIGNQVHQGGGGTAVGALVGGATGALIGRDIQRSNQPDYVARRGHTTQCHTAYRPVQTQVGYNVQYLYKDNLANLIIQNPLPIGSKMPLPQLQALAVPQQSLSQAAVVH